jgi:hypothetical protein
VSRRDDWLPPPPPGAPTGADTDAAAWDDPPVGQRPPDAPDPADRVDVPGPTDLADLTDPADVPGPTDVAGRRDPGARATATTELAGTTGLPRPDGADRRADPSSPGGGHEVRTALEELARATTPRERFTALRELTDAEVGYDDLVALLDAVPDGWQRRTVVRRLVRAGVLHDVDASRVVRRFARDGDRAHVAGLLVDAGLAHVGTVSDDLEAAVVRRLRRRQG